MYYTTGFFDTGTTVDTLEPIATLTLETRDSIAGASHAPLIRKQSLSARTLGELFHKTAVLCDDNNVRDIYDLAEVLRKADETRAALSDGSYL